MRAGVHMPQRSQLTWYVIIGQLAGIGSRLPLYEFLGIELISGPGGKLLYPLADPQIFSTQGQELRMVECLLSVHKTMVSTTTTKL